MTELQLAQLRPADTNTTTLFTSESNKQTTIQNIIVCNTTAGAVTFQVFADADGNTYDEDTALYWNVSLAANTTLVLEANMYLNALAGSIGVRSASADALTFTVNGTQTNT